LILFIFLSCVRSLCFFVARKSRTPFRRIVFRSCCVSGLLRTLRPCSPVALAALFLRHLQRTMLRSPFGSRHLCSLGIGQLPCSPVTPAMRHRAKGLCAGLGTFGVRSCGRDTPCRRRQRSCPGRQASGSRSARTTATFCATINPLDRSLHA